MECKLKKRKQNFKEQEINIMILVNEKNREKYEKYLEEHERCNFQQSMNGEK